MATGNVCVPHPVLGSLETLAQNQRARDWLVYSSFTPAVRPDELHVCFPANNGPVQSVGMCLCRSVMVREHFSFQKLHINLPERRQSETPAGLRGK